MKGWRTCLTEASNMFWRYWRQGARWTPSWFWRTTYGRVRMQLFMRQIIEYLAVRSFCNRLWWESWTARTKYLEVIGRSTFLTTANWCHQIKEKSWTQKVTHRMWHLEPDSPTLRWNSKKSRDAGVLQETTKRHRRETPQEKTWLLLIARRRRSINVRFIHNRCGQ